MRRATQHLNVLERHIKRKDNFVGQMKHLERRRHAAPREGPRNAQHQRHINEGLERNLEHGARGRRAQQQGRQCQNHRKPRGAKRRHKGCPQPAYGAHGNEHQRDSRHQHEVQRALRQTHTQDANEHPHQTHRRRNGRKGAVDYRPALVRASTQANPLKQARQVQDILLHHAMPSSRGLIPLLDRKPARQFDRRHAFRFP